MTVYIGSNEILDAKLGSDQVEKLYLGETEVWSNTPPTPPEPIKALKFSCEGSQQIYLALDKLSVLTPSFEYSLDGGNTWNSWDYSAVSFGNGVDFYLRGMNTVLSNSNGNHVLFKFANNSNLVDCTGNIMHLFDYTQDLTAFPNDATSYGASCFFTSCQALRTPPDLPATTLVSHAYSEMFSGCSHLIHAPKLPATTMTDSGYRWMFQNCYNLEEIPYLPATTMANRCYGRMFYGCSKIKMSATQTGEYVNEFPLPATYTSTQLGDMFTNTGGTFTGTPTAQMYYTSNEVIS